MSYAYPLQDNVEVNLADKKGKTPLALAMGREHSKIVAYLKKESRRRTSLLPKLDAWTIIFGPPGNTKGPLLFLIFSVLFWGYPCYVIKVRMVMGGEHGGIMKQETVSAYRPICTADALYGLV